ncbi:MAG TPA: Stf0 family sulfotransferase [Gaiellaceae bacterium]|nr:Stf0 family sulfotransferase [Gaiellaceae bacterium]
MATARRSVFLCATQRTGSWLLAHLMASSGTAGRPAEFFDAGEMRGFREEWRVASDREYVNRVLELGTTPNGVFATKLMWNAIDGLLFRRRRLVRAYESSDLEVIESVFPSPRFIWLRREDVVAQAVSWAKASQTEQYAAHQTAVRDPTFDFEHIDGLMHLAKVQNGAWQRWFAAHEITPVQVTYEELCEDEVRTTLRVLRDLDLDADGASIAAPLGLERQADSVNAEWIRRYRAEAAL